MSKGYRYRGTQEAGGFEYIHHFGPAGSMSSSATDMARFMIAHLQNGRFGDTRILQDSTAELAHSRQFSPSPYVNGSGLGFYETWINGRRFIGHAGDTTYFHTDLALLKSENLGIFVSYNGSPVLPFSARGDLLQGFMDRYYPARLPVVDPPADFETRAARYAGSYRFSRHSFTKNEKLFGILTSLKVAPTDHDTLLVALPGEVVPGEFVEVAPDTFRRRDGGDMIAFAANEDGKVTHFVGWPLAFMAAYKVPWYQRVELYGLIAVLAILCSVAAILGALRSWKADRAASPTARRARPPRRGHRSRHLGVRGAAGGNGRQQHRRAHVRVPRGVPGRARGSADRDSAHPRCPRTWPFGCGESGCGPATGGSGTA